MMLLCQFELSGQGWMESMPRCKLLGTLANTVDVGSKSMPKNVHNFVFKPDIGVTPLEQSAD